MVAETSLSSVDESPLVMVPRDLILSVESVHEHAKCDVHFREVLEALGSFGRVSNRHIFLAFDQPRGT